MLVRAIIGVALAAAASAQLGNLQDVGNGVHVPGAVPANLNEPLQHRLSFAGATGITVSWSSFNKLENPTVIYGESPQKLDQIASSTDSTTYPTSRTYNNHVKLTNLKPDTTYYYKVSYTNTANAAYRPLYTFQTSRAAGDPTPFTIATFADLGLMGPDGLSTKGCPNCPITTLGPNETNTIQSLLVNAADYKFLMHIGDIGYADYAFKEAVQGYFEGYSDTELPTREETAILYESLSEQFFDQMQPVTAERPWMVAPGNHGEQIFLSRGIKFCNLPTGLTLSLLLSTESQCINGGYSPKKPLKPNNITGLDWCLEGQKNFTFYKEHYRMPSQESGGVNNFWYSFDYGLAHFIMLDTETDLGHGLEGPIEDNGKQVNGPFGLMNQQVDWLKNDLNKVDRSKTPFVLVGMHRPYYVSVKPEPYPAWQQAFEQIFIDNKVDLVMTGHVHIYERFAGMNNGTVDPNGWNNPSSPVYVNNGAAGHYDGLDTVDKVRQNGSLVAIDSAYGWGRLTVHNTTHLTYEYIASTNGTVLDSATLFKSRDKKPTKPGRGPGNGPPGQQPNKPGKGPKPGKGSKRR
ncbi:hypothetical protein OIO90_001420 [Microbotryomycetes sp. JL221]|nr:hypothetical protein OIO90_001420 [Microbotryomycetes sp. JL221]